MSKNNKNSNIVNEEIKATKLFIWLFYVIYFTYDIAYYYILPKYADYSEYGLPKEGLGYWFHIILLGFVPIAIILIKKDKPHIIKYFYIYGYTILDIINTLLIYLGNDEKFASGSLVEVFLLLFSSLFINKRYFWVVFSVLVSKYIFYGLILGDARAFTPIIIFVVIAGVSYLFLGRFYSYIKTLNRINEDLLQKEKLALVGQLATSIGHEIRNPLAALKGITQLQKEKYPSDNDYFQIMINEVERLNLIVNDLMFLGKPKRFAPLDHDIREIIKYVVKILNPFTLENKVNIELELEEVPKISCDENQLKQLYINLIKNSIESMPNGGRIKIYCELRNKSHVAVFIEDEGCGIPEDKLKNLGQPFYTTKTEGTGLGLMVTKLIIEQHQGEMKIISGLGVGTKVEINFPITQG